MPASEMVEHHTEVLNTDIEESDENMTGELQCYRTVAEHITPFVGQVFSQLNDAIVFYKNYAIESGFDVRLFTTKRFWGGELKSKLLVCNREGFAKSQLQKSKDVDNFLTEDDTEHGGCSQRTTKLTRVGCKAKLLLTVKEGVLTVSNFIEEHNHELVRYEDREFQKLSRNVSAHQKELIINNTRLRIGATTTYRMCKENVKGLENIGANLVDFKKFQRDLKCFINQQDGQLFIDRFKSMAENREGFYFDYDVDKENRLCRVIWSDATARRNYSVFGDALSFDPTYGTNKYFMLFKPFTGVDNHKRTVTFGGALLAHEDYDSFNWVFSRFLTAMGGKEPEYIITDQDPTIIKSVTHIFKKARHRFCMWHIMNKVPTKFGTTSANFTPFIKKLNEIVWNDEIDTLEFDSSWNKIMVDHGVGKDDWFDDIFKLRNQWVLAYCKVLKMGGIMRTTQRSESVNSFFKRFEDKCGTLVEFWMRFETAIDQQRHNSKKLDNENRNSMPRLISHLPLEGDGAKVYTHAVFYDFQVEIKHSMTTCSVGGYCKQDGVEITTVNDALNGRSYIVEYESDPVKASCTCRLLDTRGLLCRHIIWIFSGKRQETIPKFGISPRWTKNAMSMKMYDDCGNIINDFDVVDMKKLQMSKLWSEVYATVGAVRERDIADVENLCAMIKEFKEKLLPIGEPLSKEKEMEKLLGCTTSKEVIILPPKQSKNKGSGKRLLSNKAKAVKIMHKPLRMCNNCKQMAHHDKRNCPNPFREKPDSSDESDDEGEDDDDERHDEEDLLEK